MADGAIPTPAVAGRARLRSASSASTARAKWLRAAGVGFGKANEVADAIRKGGDLARKSMVTVPMVGTTLPHGICVKYQGSQIMMRPASEGTGVIAGGSMRAVLELAGVKNVLAKAMRSKNPINVVKATMLGISRLRTKEEVLARRGVATL